MVVFYLFGMYGRFWRYATVDDVVALDDRQLGRIGGDGGVRVAGDFRFRIHGRILTSVLVVDWILAGLRRCGRSPVDPRHRRISSRPAAPGDGKRVLIAGAGAAGAMVVREMQRNPRARHGPGRLPGRRPGQDRQADLRRARARRPVAAPRNRQGAADRRGDHRDAAVAGGVVRVIAAACRETGVVSHTMPGVFELLDGDVSVSRLRQVDITDLLRRDPVVSSPEAGSFVEGRRVLVTGAGGSIGYELCRQIAHGRPQCLVLLGHGENSIFEAHVGLRESFPTVKFETVIADIRDRERVFRVFDRVQPEIVFHAAAHKHVPLMEENAEEAITNNVIGTQNMIEACRAAAVGAVRSDLDR